MSPRWDRNWPAAGRAGSLAAVAGLAATQGGHFTRSWPGRPASLSGRSRSASPGKAVLPPNVASAVTLTDLI